MLKKVNIEEYMHQINQIEEQFKNLLNDRSIELEDGTIVKELDLIIKIPVIEVISLYKKEVKVL